ncbi:MAG: NYN domain-containing protein, partial [Planctomycetaceae bacterium]
MGARFLVIDGYNLLHAAGLAQSHYAPGQLARQRQRLLARLASLLTLPERARTTVIFDARDPRVDRPARHVSAAMQIVFARPHGDADLFIQHWLDTHPAPRHVTLVSGDKVLQRAARGVGARMVAGGAFLQELTRRSLDRGTDPTADEKPGHLSPEEASAWLREFGDALPPTAEPPPTLSPSPIPTPPSTPAAKSAPAAAPAARPPATPPA